MNQLLRVPPEDRDRAAEADPFFYGYRYVTEVLEDGTETVEMMPLTEEDILHPEEDYFITQKPPHLDDTGYLHTSLKIHYQGQADVVALSDCRIDWEVPGLRPLAPDITVIFGVRAWRKDATYLVKQEGGRPVLVMEVTSPSTYHNDLNRKPQRYYRAGVDCFVIVDRGPKGEDPVRLHVRRWGPEGWIDVPPDAQGRYDLAPVRLLIGVEGDRVWLYDAVTGERLPDAFEMRAAQVQAQARVQEAEQRRVAAENKAAEQIQARNEAVQAYTEARQIITDMENKLREEIQAHREALQAVARLEDRLREETRARTELESQVAALLQGHRETLQAHAAAEARAREEARAHSELEQRVRRLEEQLRGRSGEGTAGP